jgi:rhodanese-related sulfurtransferase
VPDVDRIKAAIDTQRPRAAEIIGGGFIGLEMAAIVHQHLQANGVGLVLGDGVAAFEHQGDGLAVRLASGRAVPADLVILAIGVKPDTALAKSAGIALDPRGYIIVDGQMKTSHPGVFAVGDAVTMISPLTGKPSTVPLAGPANKQARTVADAIVLGESAPVYKGALGTAIAKVFDLAVACTGLSEKACEREGTPHASVIVHPAHHAGYYPGARPTALKVLYDPGTGKVLGGQAVGEAGVDKRIDVLAAYLAMGATVHDLEAFEHAYAPPFAAAKDAINHAGFVAANRMAGRSRQVGWRDVAALQAEGAFVLDVRGDDEYADGHLDGAVNIPHTVLRERLAEVPADRFILVYCEVGIRGYLAERILRQHGYEAVANLAGGHRTYRTVMAPLQESLGLRPAVAVGV